MPSSTACGSPSSTLRSMNAPGSPSSALQITYFFAPFARRAKVHFMPVENPAPPRPRRPEAVISAITASGVIEVTAFRSATYPSCARYSSRDSGSITPQLASTMRFCFAR